MFTHRAPSEVKLSEISPVERSSGVISPIQEFLNQDNRSLLEQFLTVPNAVSAVSFAAVWDGANKMGTLEGLSKMASGRFGDLVDGFLARTLNQSSQFGAGLDATLDKIGVAKIIHEAWKREAVPRDQLAAIIATQSLNFCATALAGWKNPSKKWRPGQAGKISMALDNLCLIGHIAGYTAEQMIEREEYDKFTRGQLMKLSKIGHGLGDLSFGMARPTAAIASAEYIERSVPEKHRGNPLTKLGTLAVGWLIPHIASSAVRQCQEDRSSH